MFSEKYLAGFVDADGHLSVRARVGSRPDLVLVLSQRTVCSDVLSYAQGLFGGRLSSLHGGLYTMLSLRGGHARGAFERLKNYLVLKRDHAEKYLDLVNCSVVLRTEDDVKAVRQRVKEIRACGATREPNYPSRKWTAGYVDGDGSFVVKIDNKSGYAYPVLTILAAPNYLVGITLLHKAFGGWMQAMGQNATWGVHLSQPSKVEQVLGHFAKHLVLKKPQAYFLLGCAQGGNFRDGTAIRRTIMTLNAQQHRLSDPAAEAARLVQEVRFDIPTKPVGRPKGIIELRPRRKRQSIPRLCGPPSVLRFDRALSNQ